MAPAAASPVWVPVHVSLDSGVTWLDARGVDFAHPFFAQTVAHLRRSGIAVEKKTDLAELQSFHCEGAPASPAAFIFHASRCGSTLLANALRQVSAAAVISEAQPINAALASQNLMTAPSAIALLRGTIDALGQLARGRHYFLKLTSWNILYAHVLREQWPKTPAIFLYRDPRDILRSHLLDRGGWMALKQSPKAAAALLGVPVGYAEADEEYGARVLNKFFAAALTAAEPLTLINYSELDYQVIMKLIRSFGLVPSEAESQSILRCMKTDSHDPEQKRQFTRRDRAERSHWPPEICAAVDRWAAESYRELARRPRGT